MYFYSKYNFLRNFQLCTKELFRKNSGGSNTLQNKLLFLLKNYQLHDIDAREALKAIATRRGCTVDIDYLADIAAKCNSNATELDNVIINKAYNEISKLPNDTCPKSMKLFKPEVIGTFGKKRIIENALTLEEISHHGVEMTTGSFTGSRSYYLRGSLAQLEVKLVRYALKYLRGKGFKLMSVPDLLTEDILAKCGVPVDGERTMVYSVDPHHIGLRSGCGTAVPGKVCLSGTAEMALGGWLSGRCFSEDQLPLKLCAVSRCYRAEIGRTKEEQGIFRVHHFTKVEMFGVTANETGSESDDLYQVLVQLQVALLSSLGLHGQVVLMPPEELGNPAYSKTDLEVWLPGRGRYAELTSASNCTTYQAARLRATYINSKGQHKLVHTVNGTAVAVPRCIIALSETHQEATGRRALRLPKVLGLPSIQQQPIPPSPPAANARDHPDNATPHLHTAQITDAAVDDDEFLEKVMVYKEQCLRQSFPFKKYKDFIETEPV